MDISSILAYDESGFINFFSSNPSKPNIRPFILKQFIQNKQPFVSSQAIRLKPNKVEDVSVSSTDLDCAFILAAVSRTSALIYVLAIISGTFALIHVFSVISGTTPLSMWHLFAPLKASMFQTAKSSILLHAQLAELSKATRFGLLVLLSFTR